MRFGNLEKVRSLLGSASFLSILATGLRIGGGFFTLPLALRVIPEAEIGLYYTFLGICSMVAIVDFGYAPTVSRNAAYAMAGATRFAARGVPPFSGSSEPNWEILSALVVMAKRWYALLAGVIALALFTVGAGFIHDQVVRAGLSERLVGCWLLYSGAQVWAFATGFWLNLLMGIGAVQQAARINLLAQSAGLIALFAGLLQGWGLWSYGISSMASACAVYLAARYCFFKRTQLGLKSGRSISVRQVLRDLWPMAWRQGIVTLGAFLILKANTIVCAAKLGLQETASYGLTVNFVTIIIQLTALPLMVAMPSIAQLRVKREHARIWRIFSRRVYIGLAVAGVGMLFLASFGPWVLRLIGSQTSLLPFSLTLVLGVIWLLENHHSQYATLVLTENENPFVLPAILSGLAVFGVSWWSAGHFGVAGLIGAQGIVQLAWNNWWTVKRGLKGLRAA